MKPLLLVLLVACVVVDATHNVTKHHYKLRYDIYTNWDATPVDHYPAYVELSLTAEGDIQVDVAAPFFNSPNHGEPFPGKCPAVPYYNYELYKFNEVIELYFVNDEHRLFELSISPRGQYVATLLNGTQTSALSQLPLYPYGVEVYNPNVVDGVLQSGANKTWTGTVVIPRSYFPFNVTKFNAYFIHGKKYNDATPSADNFVYEALYPSAEARVAGQVGPDRHYLGAFRNIDLSEIGFVQQPEYSPLWKNATNSTDFEFTYNVSYTSDCEQEIQSDFYHGEVTVKKVKADQKVSFYVKLVCGTGVKYDVPEALRVSGNNKALDSTTESVFFNYRGANNESVRFGVNPYGAYVVQLRNDSNEVVLAEALELQNVQFTQGTGYNWEGRFDVPWTYLPPVVSSFQVVHFHRPLAEVAIDAKKVDRFEFVGAVFPGFKADQVDWRGAGFDFRSIVDKEFNSAHSNVWVDAVAKKQ